MVDITHKTTTLRKAVACATLQVSSQETIDAIEARRVPKGDVFEFSRAAGLLAVKKTSDVIPDCHPLPVEYTAITHRIEGLSVVIEVEVHAIYRTGVEVEAMHGAAVTALTMYDMLKPIDKGVEIGNIRLLQKRGGKSDHKNIAGAGLSAAVVVCSDTISRGENKDTAGKAIAERLQQLGVEQVTLTVIPDEVAPIQAQVLALAGAGTNLVIFTGGTGLSPHDVTPDAIAPLLEIPVPGIMEAVRQYGQQRMPFAMLSRGVAGFIQNTLVLTLPGSEGAVKDAMEALFPHLFHVFKVRQGMRHS
jgi:molybdenum cofactor biosynthesis protein MoaC